MRTTKSLLLAALAILSVSCAKENIKETTPSISEDGFVELTFNALSSEMTKTSIGENVNGKYAVNWSKTDKIAVLDGKSGETYEFNYVSGEGTKATFCGKVSASAEEFYALYPYSGGVTCGGTEYIDVPLSNDQTTTATGISSGVMVAYADENMNLRFKNVTAYIKLTIPSGITYVSFVGANKEKLAGKLSFKFDGNTVSDVIGDDGKEISFGDGESELTAGAYYLAVAPVALPNGFVVEYMNVEGKTATEKGTIDPKLTPGMILNLGERNPFKPLELTKGAAWEWTATEKVWSTAGTQTINEQDWSLAYSGDAYYGYEGPNNGDRGLQFGSKKALASSVTLSSSFGNAYGIDEIVVNAACAKDSDAKLKVSVNGKNFLCENVMSVSLTQSATEYTFKSSELLAGDIVITLSQTTKKAMYLKSIFINPVEKTQLATPTNIVAAVDENIKNKINVSWDAVENAGSYVVSCGDLDPVTTTTPSASFENLTWSTDYKFSVVAKPSASDVEHLDSDMGESDVVSVGENPAPYMELSTNKEEVAADATSASFAVKSNFDWTVSTDASWVTLGTTSGSNDGTVALSFTANAGKADRTATVTVKSSDDAISQTYTLIQKAKASSSVKTLLFSEGFGNNTSSARAWKDEYKEQGGIQSVYSGAKYTIDAKQTKNTQGKIKSGLQGIQNKDASFIVGPLSVAQYEKFSVSYYWKAGSIGKTYYTKLYYSIDGTNYIEVSTDAKGATTFVEVNGDLSSLDSDKLYLKIIFCTSNTQALIDEVKLYGYSK